MSATDEESRSLLTDTQAFRGLQAEEALKCYNRALQLARDTIVEPVRVDRISEGSEFVNDKMITELQSLSRRACVYGCLSAHRTLAQRAEMSIHRAELLRCRAFMCEVLAIRLVEKMAEKQVGREELFVEVLTPMFNEFSSGTGESPLQVAVESNAVSFINTLTVQQCVEYIWRGLLLPRSSMDIRIDRRDGDGYVQGYQWPTTIKVGFAALPEGRISVPLYRYAAETAFSFILLGIYTFVVNYRTPNVNIAEIIMYLLVVAFGMTEIKQFTAQGSDFYFLTLFNGIDTMIMLIFTAAFGFRCYGQWVGSDDILKGPNDASYDLLACNAVFLWTRAIHVLSGFRYFGEMVVIIRSMMRDAAYFFIMFSFVLVGFVQAFAGLARATPAEGPGFGKGIYLLAKAFLQAPDFEDAERMHDVLGPPLLIFFMVLASVIMLNMLIAFFNQSYTVVVDSATQQHVFQFTLNVLGVGLDTTRYPFIPPTNLLEPFLYLPHLMLPERKYLAFRRWVWIVAVFPSNLLLAIFEELMPQTTAQIYRVKEDKEFAEEQEEGADRCSDLGTSPEQRNIPGVSYSNGGDEFEQEARPEEMLKFLVAEIKALRKQVDQLSDKKQ
ncbi:hypothetical protein PhCBS80983_g03723 [Powellomyces hirtus]|uniref:Uncharacterized protein n=1 Tax=Powellomyces hirtus TaxID=109895 RepID=A0A507E0L1_9FUNG|nr:hypothetical protein PhCBS80983_g03723 [Powellomyces hirtus]